MRDDESRAATGMIDVSNETLAFALPESGKKHDPLTHEEWDPFWKEVETYFRPINETDVKLLRNMDRRGARMEEYDAAVRIPPLNFLKRNDDWDTMSVSSDENNGSQAGKRPKKKRNAVEQDSDDTDPVKDEVEDLQQRLNSYPFTHRLMAALVDEGGGKTMSIPNLKSKNTPVEDSIWLGLGDETNRKGFQRSLEIRVTNELKTLGLLDADEEDSLQSEIRMLQWALRDTKMMNKARRDALITKVLKTGLKNQGRAREIKRGNDQLETLYLERMIRKLKKNKRLRSKYQKVLKALFPDYKMQKKDLDDSKDDEPVSTAFKSAKKKSYNKKPAGPSSSKAAEKKKSKKEDDVILTKDVDDDPAKYFS